MNNNKRNPFTAKDKGFYIALIVCVAAVGIGIWAMLNFKNTDSLISAEEPLVSEEVFNPKTPVPTQSPSTAPSIVAPSSTPKSNPKTKTTFMWPVSGDILVPYSPNALTYDVTMADWRAHSGIDIKSNIGTGVSAVSDGKVIAIENGGMEGTTVKIEHANGLVSVYSNLSEKLKVSVGAKVQMGGLIGAVGQTAIAEAGEEPHLHFEMTLNGKNVNPQDYLPS